jgi:hypothetical protein
MRSLPAIQWLRVSGLCNSSVWAIAKPCPDFAEVAFSGSRFQKDSWQDCDRHLQVSFITFLEWDKRGNFA